MTDHEIKLLHSCRKQFRTIATMLNNELVAFRMLAKTDKNCAVAARMAPLVFSHARNIADQADAMIKAGGSTPEQWHSLADQAKRVQIENDEIFAAMRR
jgi:hypothetical protein